MVSFTSSSSSSMPRSGIKYAYQDSSSSTNEERINKFSQIISEDFLYNTRAILNAGDIILITLRNIYRDPKSSISFPEITASNTCLKLSHKQRIEVQIKEHQDMMVSANDFLDNKEYKIEVLKPQLDHHFMILTLGVKMFSQLQSAFSDADKLIYSFLKQPIQNVNLFEIRHIKNHLVVPKGVAPPTIEKDFKRIQSIVRFLFTTLSTYETCALQKKPLHQLNFMQLILTSTPLPSPLIEEIMSYVDDDCGISIEYDVEDNLKQQQQQISENASIFSCFNACECW